MRYIITILAAVVGLTALFSVIAEFTPDADIYVEAARTFWNHGDPYWSTCSGTKPGEAPAYLVWSSPLSLVPLLPLIAIPRELFRVAYHFLFASALIGSFLLLARCCWTDREQDRSHRRAVFLLLIFPYAVLGSGVVWGTFSFLTLFGVSLLLVCYVRGHLFLAGIAHFLLFKPHLIFPSLLYTWVHALRARNYRYIVTSVGSWVAITLIALSLNPRIFEYYTCHDLSLPYSITTQTMPNILRLALGIESKLPLFLPLGILSLLGIVSALRTPLQESEPFVRSFSWLLPLSVLFGPYAWPHDYLQCLPGLFLLARSAAGHDVRLSRVAVVGIVALQILALVVFCLPKLPAPALGPFHGGTSIALLILVAFLSAFGAGSPKKIGEGEERS